jgi:hypothetical protein
MNNNNNTPFSPSSAAKAIAETVVATTKRIANIFMFIKRILGNK